MRTACLAEPAAGRGQGRLAERTTPPGPAAGSGVACSYQIALRGRLMSGHGWRLRHLGDSGKRAGPADSEGPDDLQEPHSSLHG